MKYGNSNALVLDKALLELLNITEGSLVKIKTDGTSLIITPHDQETVEKVSPTVVPMETLSQAMGNNFVQAAKDPVRAREYLDKISAVEQRYKEAFKKLQVPEFQQEYQALAKQFEDSYADPEFSRLNAELTCKYMPEFASMQQEMGAISAQYADITQYDEYKKHNAELYEQAKKIHAKYSHLQPEVMKLQENPDYIHDLVVLAEQYQTMKDATSYISQYGKLITKYIPEYAQYQKELHSLWEK